ncbi:hypothetical protein TSOC_012191 [Tetrabaena socialis]|uniref:Uncharacterized protein n=1 Tax=Tetrabaena socialis TaxID=47790 RepID=A0A2J7ZNN1_9CHLO|nr:hypothetical protein TSOC_012191 [Tetrabaena socialis]|eukprot:PNH01879.1 hypothetical protein TSOC_012191 [Tetrabaena socialis]
MDSMNMYWNLPWKQRICGPHGSSSGVRGSSSVRGSSGNSGSSSAKRSSCSNSARGISSIRGSSGSSSIKGNSGSGGNSCSSGVRGSSAGAHSKAARSEGWLCGAHSEAARSGRQAEQPGATSSRHPARRRASHVAPGRLRAPRLRCRGTGAAWNAASGPDLAARLGRLQARTPPGGLPCFAAPGHTTRTSTPAVLTPMLVASLTASTSGSNLGLKWTVKAESMMRPPTCVPKSTFITSSYASTVLSPALGVQCAATLLREQPLCHSPSGYLPSGKSSRTGTDGGLVCSSFSPGLSAGSLTPAAALLLAAGAPLAAGSSAAAAAPAFFFFFLFFFFFFLAPSPPAPAASPASPASPSSEPSSSPSSSPGPAGAAAGCCASLLPFSTFGWAESARSARAGSPASSTAFMAGDILASST